MNNNKQRKFPIILAEDENEFVCVHGQIAASIETSPDRQKQRAIGADWACRRLAKALSADIAKLRQVGRDYTDAEAKQLEHIARRILSMKDLKG